MNVTTSNDERSAKLPASHAVSPNDSDAVGLVRRAAGELERLAKRVESSLIEQFREFELLLARNPGSDGENDAREQELAEFARRRSAWELQRGEEVSRIERERAQLGEAWARLEAEQRRILAEDALRRAQASSAREANVSRAHDTSADAVVRIGPAVWSETATQPSPASARETVSRDSVMGEYEQLKSDVQKHARRLRRSR